MTNSISRRKMMATTAAVIPAAALAGTPALAMPAVPVEGSLAGVVKRYFAEIDAFNSTHHATDEESNAHADATYERTLSMMIGVPARTGEDALAVLDWLLREGVNLNCTYGDIDEECAYGRAATWLVDTLHDYLAATA